MTIKEHDDLEQSTPEWLEQRRGMLTASEAKHILTPKYKVSKNEKTRMHVNEIAAQRVSGFVEETPISFDMMRGTEDEIIAREIYKKEFGDVREVGFITNNDLGFDIGYSPDGLIDDDGAIEIKSRKQKYQIQAINEWEVPDVHDLQVQFGLFVTKREYMDYIQYCGGMKMCVIRAYPDPAKQAAIKEAVIQFEAQVQAVVDQYESQSIEMGDYLVETEQRKAVEVTYDD